MRICLVATFPPSGRQLNEYAFHIARELRRNPMIHLTILADELADYQFATDGDGKPVSSKSQAELPGFDVVRCWKFNDLTTPVRLLKAIRKCQPDIVWFNLVFSSFATQDHPVAAFAGCFREAGFATERKAPYVERGTSNFDGSVSTSFARSSERAPGCCRRQPSHQTGVLGIDTGSATGKLTHRISRLRG